MDKSRADSLISRLHGGVRLWWPAWWSPRRTTTARIRRRMARRLAARPAGAETLARDLVQRTEDGITAIGREALAAVTGQDAIDAVCRVWSEALHDGNGNAQLIGQLISQAGWLASGPARLRVLTALQSDRPDVLTGATPELARALVTAADEERPPLRGRARDALRSLRGAAARDAVCALAVEDGSPGALDAALAGSFRPSDPAKRAVLLFLAGDFGQYTALDFDGALLRAARLSAHPSVRARLARQAAAAGRVEWVREVAGDLAPARLAGLADSEWDATVKVLAGAGRWAELWPLALAAPPLWSARMLAELGRHGWLPGDAAERAGCARLAELAGRCAGGLPPAVGFEPAAGPGHDVTARYRGLLAIAPDGGALACSDYRTVSVWRLPDGEQAGEFPVPGAQALALSPDGQWLLISKHLKPHQHADQIELQTRAVPSGELISSWRDGDSHVIGYENRIATSPDGRLLARLAGRNVHLWELPGGRPAGSVRPGASGHDEYVSCLAFCPDGSALLCAVGTAIRVYDLRKHRITGYLELSAEHLGVDAMALTRDGSRLVTADSYGNVLCWRFPSGVLVGRVVRRPRGEPEWRSPSLAVTPDGTVVYGDWLHPIRLRRLAGRQPAGEPVPGSKTGGDVQVTADGTLLAAAVDGQVRLWRSALTTLCRTPVDRIGPAEIGRLRGTRGLPLEGYRWLDLAAALTSWGRRHDIELTAARAATGPAGADIEAADIGTDDIGADDRRERPDGF